MSVIIITGNEIINVICVYVIAAGAMKLRSNKCPAALFDTDFVFYRPYHLCKVAFSQTLLILHFGTFF